MKKTLFVLASLLAAFCAHAYEYTEYNWAGELPENAGFINISAARRMPDNLLVGQFFWDEITYDIAGWQDPDDRSRIGFTLFRSGYSEGTVIASIDGDGNLDGMLHIGFFSTRFNVHGSSTDTEFPMQFVTPSINDMPRFTLFSSVEAKVLDEGEESRNTGIVLERDLGSLAFRCVGGGADGLGSFDVLDNSTDIRRSFEYYNGCFNYDNPPHHLDFEMFENILVVHYSNEEETGEANRYSMADGIYSLKYASDDFDSFYFDPRFYAFEADGEGVGEEDCYEEDSLPQGEAAWGVGNDYQDVLEMSLLTNTRRIFDKVFPVKTGQAAKPDINMYFHALADEFKDCGGLFKKALPVARPDFRNGYLNVSLPGAVGGEGLEMCFWRGNEGRDIVALKMRYDETDVNGIDDDRIAWSLYFFRYDPDSGSLSFLTCCDRTGSRASVFDKYDFHLPMEEVQDVKLPQVGKTIQFLDQSGKEIHSCVWDAEHQWFKRSDL